MKFRGLFSVVLLCALLVTMRVAHRLASCRGRNGAGGSGGRHRVVSREKVYSGAHFAFNSCFTRKHDADDARALPLYAGFREFATIGRSDASRLASASDGDGWAVADHRVNFFEHANLALLRKSSPSHNMDIQIHVFVWKRVKSLERLLRSIRDADYSRSGIPLVFHVDAGHSPRALDLVYSFNWIHGDKHVKVSETRQGLENIMMQAWNPQFPDSLALFLEDDISVSPLFFTYASWCASRYLTSNNPYIMGCSLYTPRLDEINPATDPQHPPEWHPSTLTADALFLFQLPCSWGAIYRGAQWTEFTNYLTWRRALPPGTPFPAIPQARSNTWNHSWKRYLIEHMHLTSRVLVYPSFRNETSFSTNHYEAGVHSVRDGDTVPESDFLREDVDTRFTVSLLAREDSGEVWRKLGDVPRAVEALEVVDLWGEAVEGGIELLKRRADEFRKKVELLQEQFGSSV
ncbi:hypothetical protein BC830DRAFT_1164799 [Chytriomyces sp. MP71]|nr:hypothetical protein BC830DRAFT_1164799 [Chytriomyces sp. MP71]